MNERGYSADSHLNVRWQSSALRYTEIADACD